MTTPFAQRLLQSEALSSVRYPLTATETDGSRSRDTNESG
jgi:hypothetical protein